MISAGEFRKGITFEMNGEPPKICTTMTYQ